MPENKVLQCCLGILALLGIFAVGFAVFFLLDIVLLDADPIGKLISGIAGAVSGK